jgi:hypothetical protein
MSDKPVPAVHVSGDIRLLDVAQPGAFQFQDFECKPIAEPDALPDAEELWLDYCCPRTGEPCGSVLIGKGVKPTVGPSWKWDGSVYAPTLEPSINCKGGCGWHGYLIKGVFTPC